MVDDNQRYLDQQKKASIKELERRIADRKNGKPRYVAHRDFVAGTSQFIESMKNQKGRDNV